MTTIVIPGRPQPKGRPRVAGGRAFTPSSTRDAEERVAWALRRHFPVPLAGKLVVSIVFSTADPRADLDNLAKLILDAGNSVAWIDDQHIWELHVKRYQVSKGDAEKTIVSVEQIIEELGV